MKSTLLYLDDTIHLAMKKLSAQQKLTNQEFIRIAVREKIEREIQKDNFYKELEYTVVRIPYFVQLTRGVVELLFSSHYKLDLSEYKDQKYPHGFIDSRVISPIDFCILGLKRYKEELKRFEVISGEINRSVINKIRELNLSSSDRSLILDYIFS